MATRSRHRRPSDRPPSRVWPADEPGRPPLDGIVAALSAFEGIGDADPLAIEVRISQFLAELGAGGLGGDDADADEHEDLLNGVVEVCLHHLDHGPPRVIVDFCWVLDAFHVGYLQWPLRERLELAPLPSAPAWAVPVGRAELTGGHVSEHDGGEGCDVVLTARHPTAEADHVIAVYVAADGGAAVDSLVHHDAAHYLRLNEEEPSMDLRAIDAGAAIAQIDAAFDVTLDGDDVPPVTHEFAANYSLVEHYLAKA